jgi:hypothetical protein
VDPDPHQGDKSNPDPHQKDADPQHCRKPCGGGKLIFNDSPGSPVLYECIMKRLDQGHLHGLTCPGRESNPGLREGESTTLEKNLSNSLFCCYSEPLQYGTPVRYDT